MRSRFVVATPALTSSTIMSTETRVRAGSPCCNRNGSRQAIRGRGGGQDWGGVVASGRHRGIVTIIDPIRRAWERDGQGLSHVVLRPTRDLPPGSVRAQPNRPQGKTQRLLGPSGPRNGGGGGRGNRVPREPPPYNTLQSRQLRYVSRVLRKNCRAHRRRRGRPPMARLAASLGYPARLNIHRCGRRYMRSASSGDDRPTQSPA